MAKKRTLSEAEAEIAALRAQLAATGAAPAEDAPVQRYPCVMYRKTKVTAQHPHGYETKRVKVLDEKGNLDEAGCEAQVATLEKAGWLHSPETLVA